MMKQKFALQTVAAGALFTLGNAVITMPNLNFWGLILSGGLSLMLMYWAGVLLKLGQKNKIVFAVITIVIFAAAIYGAAISFFEYIQFLKTQQMPTTSAWWLVAAMLGVVIAFSGCNISVIYKYGLLVAVMGGSLLLLCFIVGIKYFDFSLFKTGFNKFEFLPKHFLSAFLPVVILPFVAKGEIKSVKPVFSGVSIGFVALIMCICQAVLSLGATSDAAYPYLKAVSIISSGSLFTRIDGFVYFLFFVTSLIKIVICVKAATKCVKALKCAC